MYWTSQQIAEASSQTSKAPCIMDSLLQSCASITKTALSLLVLHPPVTLEAAIEQEQALAQWLDRRLLDFEDTKDIRKDDKEHNDIPKELLETSLRHFHQALVLERIHMSSFQPSPQPLETLLHEGLKARNALAQSVTQLQTQLIELQDLQQQVRQEQADYVQRISQHQKQQPPPVFPQTSPRTVVLQRVLQDLILGTQLLERHPDKANEWVELIRESHDV
jgi:hypothetical protein